MSEAIEHAEAPNADSGTTISLDILGALERRKGSSSGRFSSIDDSLAAMKKELSKKIETFLGIATEFELTEIAMYDHEASSGDLGALPALARIDGDEDQLLLCLSMTSATFRNLLAVTLGGKSPLEGDQIELTFAERKIYSRFVDQLMSGYFEILDSISDIGIPRKPYLIDIEGLQGICSKIELVSIRFEMEAADKIQTFIILAPLEVLEPAKSTKPDDAEAERKQEAERAWSETLLNSVDNMEIPLSAQAASIDMALSEISGLKVGQKLNLTLNPDGVKFLDAEGKFTFLADMVFQKNHIRLRVAAAHEQAGR